MSTFLGEVMDNQLIFNIVTGSLGTLIMFLLNTVWRAVSDLQTADKEVINRIAAIEILVAGQYVKKDELDRHIEALFRKLDKIDEKLDKKADKNDSNNRSAL